MRTQRYSVEQLADLLPWPQKNANKYSRGVLAVVAGCARFPGAACLAATAAERMGAGYTAVACAPESVAQVRAASPSLVVEPWADLTQYAALDPDVRDGEDVDGRPVRPAPRPRAFSPMRPGHPRAVLVGSGFDAAAPGSAPLVHAALAATEAPVLVDGGGLAALALPDGRLLLRRRFVAGLPTVVTPHMGEAARLAAPLALSTDDPGELARLLSLAYGVIAVVKGPVTFVSDGDRIVRVNDGTAALAKAGTGDVLAGMTGALLAQGVEPLDACVLAVSLHARAGKAAAKRLTDICVTAADVVQAIPEAVQAIARS